LADRRGVDVTRDPEGVTLANWQDYPHNRWAFLHLGEILHMAPIPRGDGPVRELKRADERDLLTWRTEFLDRTTSLQEMLDDTSTDGFLVLHDGRILAEWYADGMLPTTRHLTMSITKSLTSALTAVMVRQGLVGLRTPVTEYVDELRGTAFEGCTVEQLLDMRAGIRWNEDYEHFSTSDAFLYEQIMGWRPRTSVDLAPDMFSYMATLTERDRAHGGPFEYRSILTDALGWALERAGGAPFADLFSREIWSKLGAEDSAEIHVDPGGCAITDGGMCTTLRDLARFGQLYVEDGRDVVPADWVGRLANPDPELVRAFSTAPEASLYPGAMYHDLWWVIDPARGVFVALGIYGQMLLIHRSAQAVVAKFSTQPKAVDLLSDRIQIVASIALCEALAEGKV
jgi:CubicO group peptidase (beta-lactamase class C family)